MWHPPKRSYPTGGRAHPGLTMCGILAVLCLAVCSFVIIRRRFDAGCDSCLEMTSRENSEVFC
jgi:hypothetical protein